MNEFFWGLIMFLCLIGFGIIILYRAIHQLKLQINGRITELIDLTRINARASGVIEGRARSDAEHEGRQFHKSRVKGKRADR